MTPPRHVPPPSPAQDGTPPISYGQLNKKEPIFFLQSLNQHDLRAIILTAPTNIRQPVADTCDSHTLLAEVFRLRQQEATSSISQDSQAQIQLAVLLPTSAIDILQVATNDPSKLSNLMSAAIIADTTLLPRTIPPSSQTMAAIAIKWQLESLQQVSQIQPSPSFDTPSHGNARSTLPLSQLLSDIPLPSLNRRPNRSSDNSLSSDEQVDQAVKSNRRAEQVTPPTNFGFGLPAATIDMLKHYPGKGVSSTSLALTEVLGPDILSTLIQSGSDIPTFLANTFKH